MICSQRHGKAEFSKEGGCTFSVYTCDDNYTGQHRSLAALYTQSLTKTHEDETFSGAARVHSDSHCRALEKMCHISMKN